MAAGTRSRSSTRSVSHSAGDCIPCSQPPAERAIGAISGFVLFLVAGPLTSRVSDIVFVTPFLVPAAIAALGAAVLLVKSLADLPTSPVTVRGEILRLRAIGEDGKRRHYVAVDDGNSARIRAFIVEPTRYATLEQGQIVTGLVTRHLRYVRSIKLTAGPDL